jgi:hypothetical protein
MVISWNIDGILMEYSWNIDGILTIDGTLVGTLR